MSVFTFTSQGKPWKTIGTLCSDAMMTDAMTINRGINIYHYAQNLEGSGDERITGDFLTN
jgi:hypothetical protein